MHQVVLVEAATRMTLAPIRGAPPGAPNPDFPVSGAVARPASPNTTSLSDAPPEVVARRQRGAPIEIRSHGITLTFRVVPEFPAISRAMMTVHVMAVEAGSSHRFGFLQMSAASARVFLTDLRNGCCSIVAMGDEDGTVQITFEVADGGVAFVVQKTGDPGALRRGVIERTFDTTSMADELLGELGA